MHQNQKVISFHYTLTNSRGETLDSSEGRTPLSFLQGVGQIIPGLEAALAGLPPGARERVEVAAAQAYGEHDAERVVEVPRDRLPKQNVEIGDVFHAPRHPHPLTVVAVSETSVKLDANHPLAGVDLRFDVEVVEVREATAEELAHGHAHGGGCGHHHAPEGGCGGEHAQGGGCCGHGH